MCIYVLNFDYSTLYESREKIYVKYNITFLVEDLRYSWGVITSAKFISTV